MLTINKGKFKRGGEAIEVNADIAEGIRVGDHITFHRLVYEVLRLGGVYSTDAGPKRYLYVKAVPVIKDAATSGPTLHVKEWPKEWGSLRREEMYGDDGR